VVIVWSWQLGGRHGSGRGRGGVIASQAIAVAAQACMDICHCGVHLQATSWAVRANARPSLPAAGLQVHLCRLRVPSGCPGLGAGAAVQPRRGAGRVCHRRWSARRGSGHWQVGAVPGSAARVRAAGLGIDRWVLCLAPREGRTPRTCVGGGGGAGGGAGGRTCVPPPSPPPHTQACTVISPHTSCVSNC